jgi:hypothetical protein
MSDVLERLRAADPLQGRCEAPSLVALRERLEDAVAERRPSESPAGRPEMARRRALALGLTLVVLAGLALALVGRGDGRLSLLARAYAATDPAGGVLHYAWSSRLVPAASTGTLYVEYRGEVWRSGSRSRTVTEAVLVLRDGHRSVTHTERVTEVSGRSERYAYYDGHSISRGLARTARPAGLLVCTALPACAFSATDPVSALHSIYPSLHQSRGSRDVLSSAGTPIGVRVYLDPRTGDPLRVVTRFAADLPTPSSTTVFRYFRRLPLDAATEADLRMPPHPATARKS